MRADRASLDGLERVFVLVVIAVAAVATAAMLLAWIGQFRAWPLAIACLASAAAAVAGVVWSYRRAPIASRRIPARAVIAGLALAIGAGALTGQPARYHFDGVDGSVYVALASMLSASGTLRPPDPIAAALPADERHALFRPATMAGQASRFPGGIELDPVTGRLTPEFLHLFPVLMAVAGTAFGSWAWWYVNPALALLSVLGVWLIGRRLGGELTGVVAAGLLATNVAQVWFARFPSSEMTAQAFLVAGLFLIVLASDTRWIAPAAGAGLMFGLIAFTRIDVFVLLLPALVVFAIVERVRKGPTLHLRWFAAVFGLVTLAGAAYLASEADPYARRVASSVGRFAERYPERVTLALGAVIALTLTAAWGLARAGRSTPRLPRGVAIAAGLIASAPVAWLLWRDLMRGTFFDLLSPAGVAAGLGGVVVLLLGADAGRTWIVGLFFLVGVLVIGSPLDTWVLPWSLRRYVPVLLPMTMLGVAYAVHALSARRRAAPIVTLLPAALGVYFIWHTWPIAAHHVMRDGTAELRRLACVTSPTDLLIWDTGLPSHLPLATQTTLGRTSVIAPPGELADAGLRRLASQAFAAGRAVQLVVDEGRETTARTPWPVRLKDLTLVPAGTTFVDSEVLRAEAGGVRFRVRRIRRPLHLYRVLPSAGYTDGDADGGVSPEAPGAAMRVDVGARDLPHLLDGFHGAERAGDVTFRWTGAVARLRLRTSPGSTLVIRMSSGRQGDTPVMVDLEWNGHAVGRVVATPDLSDHRVTIGSAHATALAADDTGVLTIRAPTFVPRLAGAGDDTRALGVMVDALWVDRR